MILIIDNYDSFVHNLARYLEELGCAYEVVRNDAVSVDACMARQPQAILLSPGPCTPAEAGISVDLVRRAAEQNVPLLGVCLGHQCIAEAFGGKTVRTVPRHGTASAILHETHPLFDGLPSPFQAARYHSLIADLTDAQGLNEIAWTESDRTLMGIAHQAHPVFGVQFHPESVLTELGHQLLANFLTLSGIPHGAVPVRGESAA